MDVLAKILARGEDLNVVLQRKVLPKILENTLLRFSL
jgi:hypothetical protein